MSRTKMEIGSQVINAIKDKKEPDYNGMSNKPLSGLFTHSDHIKERLDFIKQASALSNTQIS